jgi:hypothetical protein
MCVKFSIVAANLTSGNEQSSPESASIEFFRNTIIRRNRMATISITSNDGGLDSLLLCSK